MQLELKNIHKTYREHSIFDNLNVDFSHPGFYLLSGPSGSGKTTLLNMIAGYEDFNSGNRIVQDVSISCIFQSYELIDELTVLENIRMGLDLKDETFNDELLIKLGIDEFVNHYPSELSGGQKQRVGIARALYQQPNVILCDEPTESLDIDNKEIVLNILKEMAKNRVVIVACHELSIVEPYYDYHYAIEEHCLVLIDTRKEEYNCENNKKTVHYNKQMMKHYLYLIVHKRTIKAVLFFSVLIIFQIIIFTFDSWLFMPKASFDALNGHIIYVDLFNEPYERIENIGKEVKPIVTFDPVTIDFKSYKINVYPLENEGYTLANDEIIVNTLVLGLYKNETKNSIIGKTLTLNYRIANQSFQKTYKIKDVIEEKDSYYPQIYYNYDELYYSLNSYFQNKLLSESANYEILLSPESIEVYYEKLKENNNIFITHSILDMRKQNESFMILYHLIFLIIQGIAFLSSIVCVLYFNKKEVEKHKTALSLMCNLMIPINIIKKEYLIEKIKYMMLSVCIILSVLLVVEAYISILPLMMAIIYTLCIFLFYVFTLCYHIYHFDQTDISMILKENKD